jgi:arylsulfatase A-like enzyme
VLFRRIIAIFVAAIAVCLWASPDAREPTPFIYPDSYHYLEMGRQLSRGEGFTSLQAYPYLLAWLQQKGLPLDPPWPNVTRFPLLPIVYGVAFSIAEPSEATARVVGYGFFTLTAVTVLALGARLFGTGVGTLAALLFVTSVTQISLASSGLPDGAAGFFLAASTLALAAVLDAPRAAALTACWLGILLGLGVLLRYDLLPFAAAAGVTIAVSGGVGRLRKIAAVALGFAVPTLPWILRNLISFGTPIAFLGIDRNLFFGKGVRDPYGFFVGGIVLRTIILALMHHELRFYASYVPVLLIFALGGIATALPEGAAALRRFGPAVGVAILAVSLFLQWEAVDLSPISRSLRDPAFTAAFARLKRGTPPGALVATNRNERVAWFADRPSLDIEPWQLSAVEEKGLEIGALLYRGVEGRSFQSSLGRERGTQFEVLPVRGYAVLVRRKVEPGLGVPALMTAAVHDTKSRRPYEPPRLVILYAPCTVNAGYLAPYRRDVFFTPALAEFGRESVVFQKHQTESDQSGTAYASILSGRQAPEHGVFSHPVPLRQDITLVTEAFAQAGWEVHFWADQGMAAPRLGYAQGVPAGNIVGEPLSGEDPRFRRILERVASEPSYRAFVLTNFTVTHYPYKNRLDELRARYPEATAELTRGLSERQIKSDTLLYQFNLGLQKDFPKSRERHGLTDERVRDLARVVEILYISGVAHLDTLFGSVVAAVDDRGLGPRSLIAFTADHGEVLFRENALFPWSHDFQLAPEVLRVPLIVRGAGLAPGRVDWVTRSIDLYPTLAGLAGVPVADHGIDGLDLSAALRGQEPPPELVAFSHTPKVRSDVVQRALREWSLFASLYPSDGIEQIWVSVRKGDRVFKLRRLPDGQFGFEVFDLASDPWERRNLFRAEDPEHAEIAAALVRYKAGLVAAHDRVPAGEGAKSPVDGHQLKALRELGYIQ